MNIHKKAVRALLVLAALVGPALAWSADAPEAAASAAAAAPAAASAPASRASQQGTEYTDKGADTCNECHDAESSDNNWQFPAIFHGKHGQRSNPRAPFGPGGLQCEACHGPGAHHSSKGYNKKLAINSFKPDSHYSVEVRNRACLACHENQNRNAWHTGAHERAGLACTDCHKLHQERDKVRERATQAQACEACHKQQRADFARPSAHPVRQGRLVCTDCHQAHGTSNPSMLTGATINQTCTSCHAEKRGPLLWEHAPVAEDCTLCHRAHGSVRPTLLVQSPPLLCQQCHSVAGHPSVARTAASLPGGSAGPSVFLLAGACTNCHTQVHGSNHPSGSKLLR